MKSKASKSTQAKARRKAISDDTAFAGKILGPPCASSLKHTLDAISSLESAYSADYKFNLTLAKPGLKRPAENKIRDDLWKASSFHRKSSRILESEFRARWFVWRATFPISSIVGVQPVHILGAGVSTFIPRALAVWIATRAGGLHADDVGNVIGRDRTTVLHSVKRAEIGVADQGSEFYKLMVDVLDFEAEHLWASKESSHPPRQG